MRRPLWHIGEDNLLRHLHPDYQALSRVLPNRSNEAIKKRASFLGISRQIKPWTCAEIKRLRQTWEGGATREDITKMFAHRKWESIYYQIKRFKIHRRHRRGADEFRYPVIGSIRDRCKEQHMSLSKLARAIGAGHSFGKADRVTGIASIIRAVHYLGGEIDIVWKEPDDI